MEMYEAFNKPWKLQKKEVNSNFRNHIYLTTFYVDSSTKSKRDSVYVAIENIILN